VRIAGVRIDLVKFKPGVRLSPDGLSYPSQGELLEVLGIARTADAALRCVEAHRPDAVLVDRETEEQHPHVVVQLMGAGAHTKVVALDLVDEAVLVLEARRVSTATVRDLVEVIQGHPTPQAA